jgi:hypothetical protein
MRNIKSRSGSGSSRGCSETGSDDHLRFRYRPGFDKYTPLLLPPDGGETGFDKYTPLLLPPDGGEIGFDVEVPLLLPPTDGRGLGLDVDTPLLLPPDAPPPPPRRSIAELPSMGFDKYAPPVPGPEFPFGAGLPGGLDGVVFANSSRDLTMCDGGGRFLLAMARHAFTAAVRVSVSELAVLIAVSARTLFTTLQGPERMHHEK